jgi:hypothetical protein
MQQYVFHDLRSVNIVVLKSATDLKKASTFSWAMSVWFLEGLCGRAGSSNKVWDATPATYYIIVEQTICLVC